ncbi:sphingosine kinase 2 [Pelobates cultripes]|uniref:sphingosine kinase n=1 Tax=Pelobates cultripes TaxID=61616 RepID=A0AAD1T9Z2_PELCU|nr:sphingosine kinase 2 [Pelobates cultripes]
MSLGYWQSSETLLHGEFGVYPSKGIRYALSLTQTGLHIQRLVPKPEDDQRTVVPILDMVGCHTLRRSSSETFAYFSIYTYPLKKKKVTMGSSRTRQRTVRTFRVDEASDYSKNQAAAEKWAVAIKCLIQGIPISSETDFVPGLLPRTRRLLLLLNPCGGRGNSLQQCHSHILPMITEADISYNLIQTERQNHARELVQAISLEEWDGIVVISGDGLLYEVINGLMERSDWEDAIKMPIGILPCGSGNALAGAINYNAGFEQAMGSELLLNCILLLCRGTVMPMDLVSVTTCSGIRSFSFLSVAWGFISDVDIESEKYRHMGSARFTVGTMVRVASLRTYKGRLSYLPVLDAHRPICRSITLAPNGSLVPFQRSQLHRTVSDMGLCEERNVMYKRSSASLDTNELPSFETPSPGSPTALNSSSFPFDSVSDSSQQDSTLHREMEPTIHHQVNGPKDDLVPALEQPIPKTWVTVEEDFVLVLAIYQSHLGADLFTAPFSCFNDGLIHLFFVKAGISRAALVRLFLAMEKGNHIEMECPYLVHVPVRAFRLEPLTRKGIITVDGERVEYGPVQAQVHNGLSNLITGSNRVRMASV